MHTVFTHMDYSDHTQKTETEYDRSSRWVVIVEYKMPSEQMLISLFVSVSPCLTFHLEKIKYFLV